MPKGVPYADNIDSSPSGSRERVHELEKQVSDQEKELDESRQAYEDSQLRIEELE